MSDCIGTTCKREGLTQRIAELTEQRDELLVALKKLRADAPGTLECEDFHHAKKDRHSFDQSCPCTRRYYAALQSADEAIAKAEKNAG